MTAASATAITADELIDLQASIDDAYAANASWMLHKNVLTYIRKLKDSNGQYLWQPGLRAAEPDLLLGQTVRRNTYLDSAITTAKKTVFNGDFSKIKFREDIVEGLEHAPQAFIGLLEGKNFGKLVVKVAPDAASNA